MEIKIDIEELRKHKLFVATPMYGGQCHGSFARSVTDLAVMCTKYGIEMRCYYLFNESLITRARNYCVDEFMRSEYTHLLFIDSDIAFSANDVLAMLALQGDGSNGNEYDIIAGPYPKKCITWEKIKLAVDKGFGDEDPNRLEHFVGDFVFNPVSGGTIRLDEPAQVLEAGTGFMMIRRPTLDKFMEAYPESTYVPDHIRSAHFDGSREIGMYFQAEVDPVSKRYLSEDYWFCQKINQAGMKTWMCPWMELQHTGSYVFAGKLAALATIGASATADPEELKKNKKK